MSAETKRRWTAIVHGNEQYPFPLSIHTDDSTEWVARDGCVSRREYIHLIAAAPDLYAALEAGIELVGWWETEDGTMPASAVAWRDKARAALAKARGQNLTAP